MVVKICYVGNKLLKATLFASGNNLYVEWNIATRLAICSTGLGAIIFNQRIVLRLDEWKVNKLLGNYTK